MMNARQVADLIDFMLTEPFTVQQLTARSGLNIQTVRAIVKTLQEQRRIHVSGWERRNEGRTKLPIYQLGESDDQARPKRISAVEATRRYKQKVKLHGRYGGYGVFYDLARPMAVPGDTD